MPKIIINLFNEKVIDWSDVQNKENEEKSEFPAHSHQTTFNFNPNPTLF